jgi:hypothetical protein
LSLELNPRVSTTQATSTRVPARRQAETVNAMSYTRPA